MLQATIIPRVPRRKRTSKPAECGTPSPHCPCGWAELTHLDTGAGAFTTCAPAIGGRGKRFVRMKGWPGQERSLSMLIDSAPQGALASLSYWNERCVIDRELGASDTGERYLHAKCKPLGLKEVILVTDLETCTVQRTVAIR